MNTPAISRALILAFAFTLPLVAEVDQSKVKSWTSATTKDGTIHTWSKITRFTPEGFSYLSATGGGTLKYKDLPEAVQQEIGFDPASLSAPTQAPGSPAATDATAPAQNPGAASDAAIKQNAVEQQQLRSDIAAIRAEMAKALAQNPNASDKTYQQNINRKEISLQLKQQQARILQAQKALAVIGASDKPTGDPSVDTAKANLSEAMRAVARLNVQKEQITLDMLSTTLNRTGSTQTYENKLAYINRDMPVRQAEVQAAQAQFQAAQARAQLAK
jgi:hypothetical protein